MKITQVIWLKQFSDKIESKHAVSRDEVEELFRNQPLYKLMERDGLVERMCTEPLAKAKTAVTFSCSSFTKVRAEH